MPYTPQQRRKNRIIYQKTLRQLAKTQTVSYRRERRYGLTEERYTAILKNQNNLCAVCKKKPPTDVDHNRKNGHFRGLLCRSCNLGLGMFADDPSLMRLAIVYLKKPTKPLSKQYPGQKRFLKPYPRGENCHNSKLTRKVVQSIRRDYAAGGMSYPHLAKKYGLHHVYIGMIVRRKVWSQV